MCEIKKPLIFITNDDGYHSKGMSVLVRLMKQLGDVVVVAPSTEMSSKSHSITVNAPLRLKTIEESDSFKGYTLDGTPVDCVKMAFNRILKGKECSLVVSGINHGSNVSINTIYSGTMAAAFEGCAEGVPSIGFSIDDSDKDADFSYCEEFVTRICKDVLAKGLDNGVCLNVNFPIGEIKGLKVCHQAKAYWNEELVEYKDPSGKPYYWLSGVFNCLDDSPQADYRVLEKSYASLVPMQVDFTAYSCLNNIKERFEDVEER